MIANIGNLKRDASRYGYGDPIRFYNVNGQLKIEYPCLPPSKNHWIRSHWASQQKRFFKPWRNWFVGEYVRQPITRCFNGTVRVTIQLHFPDKRRRDPLNFVCFPPILDCLVETKIIEDDSYGACEIVMAQPLIDGARRMTVTVEKKT